MSVPSEDLGTGSIRRLLIKQAVPASIGILFMTVNLLVDAILVGRWIGPLAIAALVVVTPISFLIASIGFSIGIGGSSVLSRALGSGEQEKVNMTFGHQIVLTTLISVLLVIIGLLFPNLVLALFGAEGKIMAPALEFYYPILIASPLQALCSMGNSVIRAEDKAGMAMTSLIIPSVANIVLDFLLIKVFDLGIFGAALATAISFGLCFLFILWFFIFKSSLRPRLRHFLLRAKLTWEIASLSFTTFARQGVISILSILLNNSLFTHGGEVAVTVYGIVSRMLMFALFPVNGITEGFLPIAGYNYGAEKYERVRKVVKVSVFWAGAIAVVIYVVILLFTVPIVSAFTKDEKVLEEAPRALRWVFAASPVIALQLVGAAYFQAAGKAFKALLLTLTKQGFFLIPLILILPQYFGIFGIWVAFPIADILATIVTGIFLQGEIRNLKDK